MRLSLLAASIVAASLTQARPLHRSTNDQPAPQETYNGGFTDATDILLRIGNGGAGQSGLVGALANAFIQYEVAQTGVKPFKAGWYLGDTTQSLANIAQGYVDIAITYNAAAENQSIAAGDSVEILYGFRDHFMLVGPKSDPAKLASVNGTAAEKVLTMFNNLNTYGQANPPTTPPTRFLSRFDKSATNIKEALLFATIGQIPWANPVAAYYHEDPKFPLQALADAASGSEYTLTDRGTYLSSPADVQQNVTIYIAASDDADDLLLNPARFLRGSKVPAANDQIAKDFMTWMKSATGGQAVVVGFKSNGQQLYSPAPSDSDGSGNGDGGDGDGDGDDDGDDGDDDGDCDDSSDDCDA